jgi:Fic family protein
MLESDARRDAWSERGVVSALRRDRRKCSALEIRKEPNTFEVASTSMEERHVTARKRGRPPRSEVYERFATQIRELHERLGGLPSPLEAENIWTDIWLKEAHHSTALEGNTLVLKQVELLLSEGRAVGNKELREYNEVKGYADAADWVYRQAIAPGGYKDGLLTLTELRHVQAMAMTPVWDVAPHPDATPREGPGNFREHEIHAFPGGMTPVTWPQVPAEIDSWLSDVNQLGTPEAIDPHALPEHTAELHARFERIHPFLDGNGRAGRLALNLILVRLGYPPAIIYTKDRPRYLRALRRADAGDAGELGEFLARAVLDNLYKFIVPAVAGPARLVPIAALADKRVTAAALRTAARRGRLQAVRGPDGQWRSSRNWVDEYLGSRYERRR